MAARASVMRSGERHQIDAADLVPADVRLLRTKNVRVVEAALTRESAPVEKAVAAVVAEVFYLFNVRRFTDHVLRRETLTGDRTALLVVAVLIVLQLLFTYAPVLQAVFQSEALDAASWGLILLLGAGVFLAVELEKAWLRRSGLHRI